MELKQTCSKVIETPHIVAYADDFAPYVLMPGDPDRAEYIAEKFLADSRIVSTVRGNKAYTGKYKGVDVSVLASGMGQPSLSIYAHELYTMFGVHTIIRVGTAGAYQPDMDIGSLVIGQSACTDSEYMTKRLPGMFCPIADFGLISDAANIASAHSYDYRVGTILASDNFYSGDDYRHWQELGVLAVDMESFALYMKAQQAHAKALTICTISDNIINKAVMSAIDRVISCDSAVTVALELIIKEVSK